MILTLTSVGYATKVSKKGELQCIMISLIQSAMVARLTRKVERKLFST